VAPTLPMALNVSQVVQYHRLPSIPLIFLGSGILDRGRDRLSRVGLLPHKAVMEFVDMHDFLKFPFETKLPA
jgi:hypothetical protein